MTTSGWSKDFDKSVEKIGKAGAAIDKALPAAAKAGAERLLVGARRRAPRRTGDLAASGRVRVVRRQKNRATYRVGFRSFYAYYQEFGTAKMAANPFLRPAADQDRGQIVAAMADEIKKRIKAALR